MPDEAMREWRLARAETLELLGALSDQDLLFRPVGAKWQPLYYQFACMARSQLVYARALQTGKMDFAYFTDPMLPDKQVQNDQERLKALFTQAERAWLTAVQTGTGVQWPEYTLSLPAHIYRLISHERLHHGQLISYFTMAELELPEHFKQNWAL
ncbi:MAG TPA: DinB family protein [Candidatus Saccharimonadales bacterium]|nr:DinB family protein [Candidatus Saccharimonadales bacterium]